MKTNPTDELMALDKITAELNAKRKSTAASVSSSAKTSFGDDVIIDLSASCTKDQAVMRLLGWSSDLLSSAKFNFPSEGLWLDQLQSANRNTLSLEDELRLLHDRARQEYSNAFPPEADTSDFDADKHFSDPAVLEKALEKQEALENLIHLIRRARDYALDIGDELAKGERSALRKDIEATEKTGVVHITLRSLDRWSKEFYPEKAVPGSDDSSSKTPSWDTDLMLQLSKVIAENVNAVGKADLSLYVTLGLAVEAIAEKLGAPYADADESPNISQIAELIGAKYQAVNGKPGVYGQGIEAIRKRLSLALKVKSKVAKAP